MFFDSWWGVGRVVIVGVLAYASLVALLRISGNRTLSKLNAFDLVITVALGSTLASIILDTGVALLEGVVALGVLIALQFVVTWSSVRWRSFGRIVKSEPVLLVHQGALVWRSMHRARVVEAEVIAAVRGAGFSGLEPTHTVVLESDGSLSVLSSTSDA